MIYSLVNRKGGVGKSTLAINLAYCLGQSLERKYLDKYNDGSITWTVKYRLRPPKKVLLVDTDPQASVMHWSRVRETAYIDVIHHPEPDLHIEPRRRVNTYIKGISERYGHTVIDAPPGVGDISLSVLLASNIIIIPVNPSPVDLWSTNEMVELVQEARTHNKRLKAYLLIAKQRSHTILGSQIRDALKTYGLPVLKAEIGLRADFSKSLLEGQSVIEYAPHSQASKEIERLTREVLKK